MGRCTRPRPRRKPPKPYNTSRAQHPVNAAGGFGSDHRPRARSGGWPTGGERSRPPDWSGCPPPLPSPGDGSRAQHPALAVGDVLLVGKFKNREATITGFSTRAPIAAARVKVAGSATGIDARTGLLTRLEMQVLHYAMLVLPRSRNRRLPGPGARAGWPVSSPDPNKVGELHSGTRDKPAEAQGMLVAPISPPTLVTVLLP
jgi:hypothetical protein